MIQKAFSATVFCLTVVAFLWATTMVWAALEPAMVTVQIKEISAVPGQQVAIKIEQTGQNLPSGYFYTVTATATTYPGSGEPDILPGFPVTKVVCVSTGQYVIRIRIHLVNKTSCGGASFETVLEEDVRITIAESFEPMSLSAPLP